MVCDLDRTVGKTCILQSPLIPDTFNWTCMLVKYQLSSQDVELTLDLLADGVSNVTHTLLANESAIWMSNEDLGSSIMLQFTASRYLVSYEDYEHALVTSVEFLPCSANKGMVEGKLHTQLYRNVQLNTRCSYEDMSYVKRRKTKQLLICTKLFTLK